MVSRDLPTFRFQRDVSHSQGHCDVGGRRTAGKGREDNVSRAGRGEGGMRGASMGSRQRCWTWGPAARPSDPATDSARTPDGLFGAELLATREGDAFGGDSVAARVRGDFPATTVREGMVRTGEHGVSISFFSAC